MITDIGHRVPALPVPSGVGRSPDPERHERGAVRHVRRFSVGPATRRGRSAGSSIGVSCTPNDEGVRAHTFSTANLTAVRLNGVAVPEAGINAAIAGHFGVPVIMVSGDDAAVEETRSPTRAATKKTRPVAGF